MAGAFSHITTAHNWCTIRRFSSNSKSIYKLEIHMRQKHYMHAYFGIHLCDLHHTWKHSVPWVITKVYWKHALVEHIWHITIVDSNAIFGLYIQFKVKWNHCSTCSGKQRNKTKQKAGDGRLCTLFIHASQYKQMVLEESCQTDSNEVNSLHAVHL